MTHDQAVIQLSGYKTAILRKARLQVSDHAGKSPDDRQIIKDAIDSIDDLVKRMEKPIIRAMEIVLNGKGE